MELERVVSQNCIVLYSPVIKTVINETNCIVSVLYRSEPTLANIQDIMKGHKQLVKEINPTLQHPHTQEQ